MTNDSKPHFVYWLHDERCICPWRHGYVGITYRPTRRLLDHRAGGHFPPDFKWTVLFTGTRFECLKLEYKLRPTQNIGWNISNGGGTRSYPHSLEARRKMRLIALEPARLERLKSVRENPKRVANLRAALAGQPKSEEQKQKISSTVTNQWRDPKHAEKMRARMKGKVGVGPKSEETKAKMRTAALRRYADLAEREKTQKAVKQAFEHIDRSGSNNPNYRTGEFCRRTTGED